MTPTVMLATKVALVVGAAAAAGGVAYVVTDDGAPQSIVETVDGGERTAWLDEPPDGSILVLGPVEVTAHAASPDGVASVEFVATGVDPQRPATMSSAATGGSSFELATFVWTPDGLGRFDLVVTGIEPDGGRTTSTSARVEIVETPAVPASTATTTPGSTSTTPTTAPPTTVAPTTTATLPTTTPATTTTTTTTTVPPTTSEPAPSTSATCGNPAPTPVSPVEGEFTRDRSPALVWDAACDPVAFTIEVSRIPGFERIDVSATVPGTERSWTVPDDRLLPCDTAFFWRVSADDQVSETATFTVGCLGLG